MAYRAAETFFFDSFTVDVPGNRIVYSYSTDAGHSFEHVLTFNFPVGASAKILAPAAFALGMAELAHFWKAILAPRIMVKAGKLSTEQIVFWENLYTKGLGEFFYINQIDFRGLVYIESAPDAPEINPTVSSGSGALVPFGGGKDSLVTGEFLKKQGKEFSWFELEPLPFSQKLKEISGVIDSIQIGRDIAKNFAPVVELVKQGAPNGHVPITATYIFSAVLAAKACGFKDVVLSLERSANEGNVEYLGNVINHQYSKTFEFEKAVHDYVQNYVDSSIHVFSLLRPLYELQIIREFTQYPQYFHDFVSCNRGLKTGSWCGECAKCAFMFAGLSAFLSSDTVVEILKKNLFEDESLIPLYEELIGKTETKPFDCVGTFDENLLALFLSGQKYIAQGLALPPVLARLPIKEGERHLPLLTSTTDEHLIPSEYQQP